MRLLAFLLVLLGAALPAAAAPQWYGGNLRNDTSPGRTEIKISADGKLASGASAVREVKPGQTADGVGVTDCDMAVAVWHYGPGDRDFKFYTRRVHNLQTLTVVDKQPGTEPSGWDNCVDGHEMTQADFDAAKKKYWDLKSGGVFELPGQPPKDDDPTSVPADATVTA